MQKALDREDWEGALQRAASHVVFGDAPEESERSDPSGDWVTVLLLRLAAFAVGLVALVHVGYKIGLAVADRRSRGRHAKALS